MKQRIIVLATLGFCLVAFSHWLEPVEYTVSVSYVNVWIKATDSKGKPVADLSSGDFKVLEDGKLMQPECFEQTKYSVSNEDLFSEFREGDQESSQDDNSRKQFIVFLDLLNTTNGELRFLGPKIEDFLLHSVDEKNDVMLAALLPNRKVGVLVPFTQNHQQVADVIEKAPGNETRDTRIIRNEQQLLSQIRDWEQQPGRDVDSPADFYRRAVGMIRVLALEEREQGMFTLKALRSFSDYLSTADLGDHTVIIYVSGGFSTDPGRHYYTLLDSAMSKYLADRKLQEPDQVIEYQEQDFDLVNEIKNTAWYLNRLNVTLYSIDARGMVQSGQDSSQENALNLEASGDEFYSARSHQDTLSYLASQTGGLAFIGTQNFANCFSKMVQDLDQQYLVCYRAPEHKKKGQFHKIQVVSKRPGVHLRYRNGYVG